MENQYQEEFDPQVIPEAEIVSDTEPEQLQQHSPADSTIGGLNISETLDKVGLICDSVVTAGHPKIASSIYGVASGLAMFFDNAARSKNNGK